LLLDMFDAPSSMACSARRSALAAVAEGERPQGQYANVIDARNAAPRERREAPAGRRVPVAFSQRVVVRELWLTTCA
jgi:hypothetical protein